MAKATWSGAQVSASLPSELAAAAMSAWMAAAASG